ncbi:MAG: hypothetical protein WC484_07485, partial [Candidatus Omnitrophota bacterium]
QPCFNNLEVPIDRGWDWCYNKTERFACTKAITPEMVIEVIDRLRRENGYEINQHEVRKEKIG